MLDMNCWHVIVMVVVYLTVIPKPLEAQYSRVPLKTVIEIEKLGGSYGRFEEKGPFGFVEFNGGENFVKSQLPGFHFESPIPKLPVIGIPIGVSVHSPKKTDIAKIGLLRNVKYLRVFKAGNEVLPEIAKISGLEKLDLSHTHTTDKGLEYLEKLKKLTSLDLSETAIKGSSFGVLKDLENLTVLNLHNTEINDDTLRLLRGHKNLKCLRLSWCFGISSDGFKELSSFKNLTALDLGMTRFRDIGQLKGLTKLTYLCVRYQGLVDNDMSALECMSTLKYLELYGNKISDEGLKAVGKLKELRELNLGQNKIGDAGISHLLSLDNLEILNLSETKISAQGIGKLEALKSLTDLKLSSVKITEREAEQLKKLKNLKRLYVDSFLISMNIRRLHEILPGCRIIVDNGEVRDPAFPGGGG